MGGKGCGGSRGVLGVVGGGCVNGRDCCNQTTTSGTRAQAHAQAVFC